MNEFKQLLSTGVATKALGLSSSTLVKEAPNASQITQTYTQDAQSKAPILPEGSTEEKNQLWQIYQDIGQTKTGRQLLNELDAFYQKTGKRVPVSFEYLLPPNTAGRWLGLAGKIVLSPNFPTPSLSLAHELRHYIQDNRTFNSDNIKCTSIKDAFILSMLDEVETALQDTLINDEKNNNNSFVSIYRKLKKKASKKFPNDAEKQERYAKTEFVKIFLKNRELPIFSFKMSPAYIPVAEFKEYHAWREHYEKQAGNNLCFYSYNSNPQDKVQADQAFSDFIHAMGVDLTPDYLRKNVFVPLLTDTRFKYTEAGKKVNISLRSERGLNILLETVDGQISHKKTYDKDGEFLSGEFYEDGKLSLKRTPKEKIVYLYDTEKGTISVGCFDTKTDRLVYDKQYNEKTGRLVYDKQYDKKTGALVHDIKYDETGRVISDNVRDVSGASTENKTTDSEKGQKPSISSLKETLKSASTENKTTPTSSHLPVSSLVSIKNAQTK